MGLILSKLKNMTINYDMIKEFDNNKIIFKTTDKNEPLHVLYYDEDIKQDCFNVISLCVEKKKKFEIQYYKSHIFIIHDINIKSLIYVSNKLTPTTLGWNINY